MVMKRLSVVGGGIKSPNQMTLESLNLIKSADHVLSYSQSIPIMTEFFAEHGIKNVQYLDTLYRHGAKDTATYSNMYKTIVSSLENNQNVVLVVAGHPRIGVTVTQWLSKALDQDIEFVVLEGVSSFCTMLNDLEIDPLEKGVTIIDANRMLLFKQQLNALSGHFIYHVCSVGTSKTNILQPQLDNKIELLRDHLLQFFPKDHPVILVSSAHKPQGISQLTHSTVCELAELLPVITFASTLYVPPMAPKSFDRNFLETLQAI